MLSAACGRIMSDNLVHDMQGEQCTPFRALAGVPKSDDFLQAVIKGVVKRPVTLADSDAAWDFLQCSAGRLSQMLLHSRLLADGFPPMAFNECTQVAW